MIANLMWEADKSLLPNIVSQFKHGNEQKKKKHTGSRHKRSFRMRDLVVQYIFKFWINNEDVVAKGNMYGGCGWLNILGFEISHWIYLTRTSSSGENGLRWVDEKVVQYLNFTTMLSARSFF